MAHTSLSDRELAAAAARSASVIIRDAFGLAVVEELKGAVDPVSEIDWRAEVSILEMIAEHRPSDSILAEESGGRRDAGTRQWIVDPLDGTVNFLQGIPHVGVSVALWEGDEPLACAVVDVMRAEVFSAAAGQGADLNGEPIRVSGQADLIKAVIGTGFPYDRDIYGAAYAKTVGDVLGSVRGVRRLGAAVLDFAWVACGRFDGYWEFHLSPWDAAGGLLLVHEAGGVSADLSSMPTTLDSPNYIVSNRALGMSFIDLVRSAAPEHVVRPAN